MLNTDHTRVPQVASQVRGLCQEELHDLLTRLDREEHRELFVEADGEMRTDHGTSWAWSAGHHSYPRKPLITPGLIADLMEGDALLSVGAGPAYAERLLVKRFRLSPSQVELSDVSRDGVPTEFNFHHFNMWDTTWPELGRRFDHIVFLESATSHSDQVSEPESLDEKVEQEEVLLRPLIVNSLNAWSGTGEIRIGLLMGPEVIEKVVGFFEDDISFDILHAGGCFTTLVIKAKETI